jgi:very-short-patch-repair endonuclease
MPNQNARQLRKNMTDAERALWRLLRQRQINGLRFRRQVPINHYIVDFACLEARLVAEVDGGQHSESQADKKRDAHLRCPHYSFLIESFPSYEPQSPDAEESAQEPAGEVARRTSSRP